MGDQAFMRLMEVLPKSALSSLVGRATRAAAPKAVHRLAMRAFARRYKVDLGEAEQGFDGYSTFAEFFSRRLKAGARPIADGVRVIASPVDAMVSQAGVVEDGACLQAKGISFPVAELLADREVAARFARGSFATLYLSPRDYHRIHAPLAGSVQGYAYLPGEFWPVNPASVRSRRALFCVNERLVSYLATDAAGEVAVVAVGATCVARIRAAYDEVLTHRGQPARTHRYPAPIPVAKGQELAAFEMGSTVILLFAQGKAAWSAGLVPGAPVRMGEEIGVVP